MRVVVAGACSEGGVWIWETMDPSFRASGPQLGLKSTGRKRTFRCKAIREPGLEKRITSLALSMTQVGSRDRVTLAMGDQSGAIYLHDIMTGTCIWSITETGSSDKTVPIRWLGTSAEECGEWVWWVKEDGRMGCIHVERAYKDRDVAKPYLWDLALEGPKTMIPLSKGGEKEEEKEEETLEEEEGMVVVERMDEGRSHSKEHTQDASTSYSGGIQRVRACDQRLWLGGPWGLECWGYRVGRDSIPKIYRIFSNPSSSIPADEYDLGGVDSLMVLEESVVGLAVTVDRSAGGCGEDWVDQIRFWDNLGRAVSCSSLHLPSFLYEQSRPHPLISSSIHTVALGGSGAGDPDGQCYLGFLTQTGWVGIWRLEHAEDCRCIEHRLFPSSYPSSFHEAGIRMEGLSFQEEQDDVEIEEKGPLRLRATWVGCLPSPGSLDLVISDGCVYGVRRRSTKSPMTPRGDEGPLGAWEAWRLDASGVQEGKHPGPLYVSTCPLAELKDHSKTSERPTQETQIPFERVYTLLHRDPNSLYIEAGQGVCKVDITRAWDG